MAGTRPYTSTDAVRGASELATDVRAGSCKPRRGKLVGVDAICVHRLLNNHCIVPEFLRVSGELFGNGGAASSELAMQETDGELEGIGRGAVVFRGRENVALQLGPVPDPSWPGVSAAPSPWSAAASPTSCAGGS